MKTASRSWTSIRYAGLSEKGKLLIYQIIKQQKISRMRAWRILRRFKGVKDLVLLKPDRHPKPILEFVRYFLKRYFLKLAE